MKRKIEMCGFDPPQPLSFMMSIARRSRNQKEPLPTRADGTFPPLMGIVIELMGRDFYHNEI
ncbi:MAG: hypothetical protein E3K36_07640 [Candidatus Brocadia sp.]|nr:hypothetical protein [Candidatus Brocadia sp.]